MRHQTGAVRGRGLAIGALLAALLQGIAAVEARAHFLYIRVGPSAEAGRWAEVYFNDRLEPGDPKFVSRVARTRLWVQARPGEFRELPVHAAADRLRAPLPPDRSFAVIGQCEYGVVGRPRESAFLLRHYPKALTGVAEELNRMQPRREIPLEIQARFETGARSAGAASGTGLAPGAGSSGEVRLVALRDGRPIPGAVFMALDPDMSEQTITAGPDGSASWTPPAPGSYAVTVRETIKKPGTLGDKPYDEIREFATVSFAWPLDGPRPDAAADALFQDAVAHRATWRQFPGFSAEIAGSFDGREFAGKVAVKADGQVEVQADNPAARKWLQDQIESLVMHRQPPPGRDASDAGSPRFRFVDESEEHPLGRLIAVRGDQMASSYRIKDHQIMVVNRRMGQRNMTITVLENDTNPEGHSLPHSYVVQYWDAAGGRLLSAETIQERWQRVGSVDLPVLHSVTTASDAGLSTRVVRFSGLQLLGP
jgi:Protein of unknown function (DUF3386)